MGYAVTSDFTPAWGMNQIAKLAQEAPALRRCLSAVIFATLYAAPVEATTTFTAPIRNAEADAVTCFAINHSVVPVQVSAVVRSGTGASLGSGSAQIGSNKALDLVTSGSAGDARYCQFDFDGEEDQIRGYIRFVDAGGSDTRLIYPASEVRGPAIQGIVTRSAPVETSVGDLVACVVQNLGNASVQVQGQIRSLSDTVLASSTDDVPPGDVVTLVSLPNPAGPTSCRFSFDGNPAAVRGYVRLSNNMGGNTRFLSAASLVLSIPTSTLVTPQVVPTGGDARCVAHNLGAQGVSMSVEMLDGDGDVLASAQVPLFQPGFVITPVSTSVESASPVSCRFIVDAPSHSVRGYLAFTEPVGGRTRFLQPATIATGLATSQATIFTPALRSIDGHDLGCWVQNLTTSTQGVIVEIINASTGALVASTTQDVDTGEVRRLLHTNLSLLSAYCKFIFSGAAPAELRGSIVLDDGTTRLLETATLAMQPTVLPTATRTKTRTATRTQTPTVPTATHTVTRTATTTTTHTVAPTSTPTSTATATIPTTTPTGSATSTATTQPSSTPTATSTVASTATATNTATSQPSLTATHTPTATPTTSELEATSTASTTPSATATPTPTEVPSETPTAEPTATIEPGPPGDANCDGVISAADLATLLLAIDEGIDDGCGEDVNEDGFLDEADVEALIAMLFGAE